MQIADIIKGMRAAYASGQNAMEWCRTRCRSDAPDESSNRILATLVAYDLQAGSYVAAARQDTRKNDCWCRQLAGLLDKVCVPGDSLLEVGVGEATTLAGVLREMSSKPLQAFGFDVSWSRCAEAKSWLQENCQSARIFVGDLMNIPLMDCSVDVVYSSHSIEPNGGREEEALRECLRISRKAVVLVEPLYELASADAQRRMRDHGYVRGLLAAAKRLNAEVQDYRLLEFSPNPLNPSGVLCLLKKPADAPLKVSTSGPRIAWRCPVTGESLEDRGGYYSASAVGLVYPVLEGIPLLRAEHSVVASKLSG